MTLRWRLTRNIMILVAVLLLLLTAYDYYNIRTFLLNSEVVRLRTRAEPIIDAAFLGRPVDEELLSELANQLATDLATADTGELPAVRHYQAH